MRFTCHRDLGCPRVRRLKDRARAFTFALSPIDLQTQRALHLHRRLKQEEA